MSSLDKDIMKEFENLLNSLTGEQWSIKVNSEWTIKDVVAHLIGWEKEAANSLSKSWKTKKSSWFVQIENSNEFNSKSVKEYKNLNYKQIIKEWIYWQDQLNKIIQEIGESNLRKEKENEKNHYLLHLNQIKKALKSISELLEFGIINIDKSSGPTSFNVSEFIKKKLGLRKTSHFGTLDPKVTGVLPVALNRACKLTGYFLGEDKEYVGIMRFHEEIDRKKIEEAIKNKFLGKINQLPPVKSRVKRQIREREIKSFEILEQDENKKDFLFKAEVQGGTYIRKLIDDLGKELGIGAHMLELRRIRAGIFKESSIVNLYDFEKAADEYKKGDEKLLRDMIISGEIISEIYPIVEIKKESVDRILHGQPLYRKNLIKIPKLDMNQIISVFSEGNFIGMFKIIGGADIFAVSEFTMQPV